MKKLETRISALLIALVLLIAANHRFVVSAAPASKADEDKVWQLEHSYWEYVKVLDIKGIQKSMASTTAS
jgi:hypothetical protein